MYAENVYGRSKPSEVSSIVRTKDLLKKPPKTKRYEGNFYLVVLKQYPNNDILKYRCKYCLVDETGKKIRGKADGHIKDYDQYGKN